MTNTIPQTLTAGQKAALTRKLNRERGQITATVPVSTTMVEAGRKAAQTRQRRIQHEADMELGLAPCAGCGKDTKINRSQTQGMPIYHAACADAFGLATGINFSERR